MKKPHYIVLATALVTALGAGIAYVTSNKDEIKEKVEDFKAKAQKRKEENDQYTKEVLEAIKKVEEEIEEED